jgi:thioredoxin-related protein
MKKFLLLSLMSLSLFASDITWYTSYVQAAQSAKTQNKPMLVFMNRPGCGSCAYMKENVFTDKDIVKYLDENYIAVSLDIHTNDAPKALQVSVTPVFYFLHSDGTQAIDTLFGGKTAPFFIKLLKQANTPAH